MGSIYRRKNSKNDWIKYHRYGKAYFASSGSVIKAVAEQLLKRREGEIAQGRVPGGVFDRYNIVSPDDLQKAAVKKQKDREKQAEWLHFGDSSPKKGKRVTNLRLVTPCFLVPEVGIEPTLP